MNSRERVIKAMSLQKPDRVPLMCQFSFGFMNQQLKQFDFSPMEFWLDPHAYAEGLLILREMFCFDGILVSVHGHSRNWRSRILKLEIEDAIEVASYHDRKEKYLNDDLPVGYYFKDRRKNIDVINVNEIPYEIDYIPAAKDCYFFIDKNKPFEIFDILNDKIQNKYSIHGEICSPFDYFLDLAGYQEALMALLTNQIKCKAILQKYTNGLIKLVRQMCKKPIDAVKISSPFAGMGFISPGQYREFVLPFESQLAKAVKNENKFVYIHTCGFIDDRLELIRDSGASGLECLDPPPIGNVRLKDAFKRVGEEMFIKGNIDSVNTLLNGSDEEIIRDVKERLKTGMTGKGFILSTACSIAPMVKKEKVKMLSELADKYGWY